jgi:hypothetical protein
MGRFAGSAPVFITIIVLGGFAGISFLAMKPELAGVDKSVVLYLLGAWQSMAAAAVAYWLGSSNSSSKKDETIAKKDDTISSMAATASNKP